MCALGTGVQTCALPICSELERVVDIDGGLLLSGGTLYVTSYQGRAAALELESGRVLWQRDASSYSGAALGYGSVYLSLADGTVDGIDERSTDRTSVVAGERVCVRVDLGCSCSLY